MRLPQHTFSMSRNDKYKDINTKDMGRTEKKGVRAIEDEIATSVRGRLVRMAEEKNFVVA